MTRAISDATWWRARAEEQRTIGEAMRHRSCRASRLLKKYLREAFGM